MLQSKVMKQRSTTPVIKGLVTKSVLVAAAVLMVSAAPMAGVQNVSARDFQGEINAVQNQIDQYQAEASRLSNEAKTLANELAKLGSEKASIQASIDLSQAKFDKLTADIALNETKIAQNKDALGVTLADMYVDVTTSPLEMIASSKNIGDYVDKQSYRSSVNDQLKTTIATIDKLKKELEVQKKNVEQILADQTAQRSALSAKESERQKLMDETKGQEQAYQSLSAAGQAKRLKLENEQQDAISAAYAGSGGGNAVAGDPGRGGYPSYLASSDYYNPLVDPWGMYSRQCVSYTAWKVQQKFQQGQRSSGMPYWGGDRYVTINGSSVFTSGHAKYWPTSARAAGIPTGNTPRAGSTGVITTGTYGHIVWVDSVNGDGTINISQYNELGKGGPGWGNYSERKNVSPGTYDTYIYF